MFDSMSLDTLSTDVLEQQLIGLERKRSQLAAEELGILEVLDRRQVATGDGCRSLSEWVAARLDVSSASARSLVGTMRRTSGRSDLRDALASGGVSFDRVEAVSRINEDVGLLEHLDVGGVGREAAKRIRVGVGDETRSLEDSFLVLQPSLDESWWRLWGGLDGYLGSIVDQTLTERADRLGPVSGASGSSGSWRRAMALVEVCAGENPASSQVTVFVDARRAVGTDGESGVVLEAGPRVGRRVLEAVLCDTSVEVIARTADGGYLDYGRRTRTATRAQKHALWDRYAGRCAVDGCDSRSRLEAHHVTPWAQGGDTDLDGLVLLCWFHHHVVVHRRGFHIYTQPGTGRVRFHKPRFRPEWEPSI